MCPISLHCHLTGCGEGSLEGRDPSPFARRRKMEGSSCTGWEKVLVRSCNREEPLYSITS